MDLSEERAEALERLILETRLLFRELRGLADRVHGELETAARRSILMELVQQGERTVPALATARNVSRQAVQGLVDALAADGLVERSPNPAHRRSWLWRATPTGEARARAMIDRERRILGGLDAAPAPARLQAASDVLEELRGVLRAAERPGEP